MNVAITKTSDNKTCIVHDEPFQQNVEFAEFNRANFQIRLAFDTKGETGIVLEYPLEYELLEVLEKHQSTYLAHVKDDNVQYMVEIPVVFVDRPE